MNKVKIPFGLTLDSSAEEALRVNEITLEELRQHFGKNLTNPRIACKSTFVLMFNYGCFLLMEGRRVSAVDQT